MLSLGTTGIELSDDRKFAFFYGGQFSNWSTVRCGILLAPGKPYAPYMLPTSEHVFMALKAVQFGDIASYNKICSSATPKDAKRFGRQVSGFSEDIWDSVKEDRMYEALKLKFTADSNLMSLLIDPLLENSTFVECSPYDKIWGIGLSMNNTDIQDESKWLGQNLLGKTLTKLKEDVKNVIRI